MIKNLFFKRSRKIFLLIIIYFYNIYKNKKYNFLNKKIIIKNFVEDYIIKILYEKFWNNK